MNKSLTKTGGFTLIELIVVIVILGIMAAIAGPKFINLQTDARISVIRGVEGSLRSAATLVYSRALIDGTEADATGTVATSDGNVTTAFGYPDGTATGIDAALDLSSDITPSGARVFTLRTNCFVTYNPATSATAGATVDTPVITGC